MRSSERARVLIIDDDAGSREVLRDIIGGGEFEVWSAASPAEGLDTVASVRPQLVFLDLMLPGVAGMQMLDSILAIDPTIDVILITGHYSTDSAVEAIQKGACDYVTKPVDVGRILTRLERWLEARNARRRAAEIESEMLWASQTAGIVGRSPQMLEVFSKIQRVAPHFQSALITGETGTGKELAGRALHRLSPFGQGNFVACNCAAVVETLFESELFGHVRGAFTGAVQDKQGLIESAQSGTLFLDEIGEMSLAMQAKLLRVLQNRQVQRLGSTSSRFVDVRFVAATHRDLRKMVQQGTFREDLYYRLSMVQIALPRLADRLEDLPLLVRHFLDTFSERYAKPRLELSRRAQTALMKHSWPGNVRELENVLGYAAMVCQSASVDVEDLPEWFNHREHSAADRPAAEMLSLAELETRHVKYVLNRVGGNRVRAAEILGISRATLYRLLARQDAASPEPARAIRTSAVLF
jgi:DNA-binding NtrC family response regulator